MTTNNNSIKRNQKGKNPQNKNKKALAKKYRRRRIIVGFISLGIVVGIISLAWICISGTGKQQVNTYMASGNSYVEQCDYNNAINSYNSALKLDKNQKEAKLMVNLINSYLKATQDYKSGNVNGAKGILDDLPADYTMTLMKTPIDGLKENLSSVGSNVSQAQDDILQLNNLYSSGKYKEALDYINKIEKEDLNSTQQVYVSEISNDIEQKLGASAGNNAFTKRGTYLNELNKLVIKVNNMELSAQTYGQKLQRAQDKYNVWNTELQKIVNEIQNNLSNSQLTAFNQDEQSFETNKNQKATEASSKYTNPQVKQTANYQIQREMTTDRCYYLVNKYM